MALPPQIAVPADIKKDVIRSDLNILPNRTPRNNVPNIDATVNEKPCFPAARAVFKFIPKPSPTIENCNRKLVIFWLYCGKGC